MFVFQIESIVKDYGLVAISRSGSNPEKFIYESDQLSQLQVTSGSTVCVCVCVCGTCHSDKGHRIMQLVLYTSFSLPSEECVCCMQLIRIFRFQCSLQNFTCLLTLQSNINLVTEWIPNDISSTKIRFASAVLCLL